MMADNLITYLGYRIDIAQDKTRFTARISREGRLVSHDGRNSEVWASESCGSLDRAILVAKNAIDSGRVE